MPPNTPDGDPTRTMTLEAFADTILPGEKRWPGDRAIAGVSTGGGAVAAVLAAGAGATPVAERTGAAG